MTYNKQPYFLIILMDMRRMLTSLGDTLYPCAGELLHLIEEKIEDYRSMRLCLTERVVATSKSAYLWFE
jgi:hypothetical protein